MCQQSPSALQTTRADAPSEEKPHSAPVASGMAASFIAVFIAFLRRIDRVLNAMGVGRFLLIISQPVSQARSRICLQYSGPNVRSAIVTAAMKRSEDHPTLMLMRAHAPAVARSFASRGRFCAWRFTPIPEHPRRNGHPDLFPG